MDFYAYMRMMDERIRRLEDRLLQLETESRQLEKTLRELKPIHIDSINYKVQELSVRDLSGTLNIGLTALSDPEQLERLINQKDSGGEFEVQANHLFQTNSEEVS
jgi:predicted RNase H-like nuclease (RuvC/YqgF family)